MGAFAPTAPPILAPMVTVHVFLSAGMMHDIKLSVREVKLINYDVKDVH